MSVFSVLLQFLLNNLLGIVIGLAIGWALPTPSWVRSLWSWFMGKLASSVPPTSP